MLKLLAMLQIMLWISKYIENEFNKMNGLIIMFSFSKSLSTLRQAMKASTSIQSVNNYK